MNDTTIERIDEIPLVVYWLLKMHVAEIIDRVLPYPHLNREGLSCGQLAVLFVAYVLSMRNHRLCAVEEWVTNHRHVLEQATGWTIGQKEATDDRLGDLLTALGEDEERGYAVQRELGQHLVQAYALPTEVGRYDTTTFSVHHVPDNEGTAAQGLLAQGHSKDYRPDLLQFKQGLATLDPAGVPLLTETLAGQMADDPLYLPAWRRMVETLGHTHFLFVADCKAAALETRAQISHAEGWYLFPLPMTGQVPETLRDLVLNPPTTPEPIALADLSACEGEPKVVGRGFEVSKEMTATLADGTQHPWTERWLVTCSDAHAKRQQHTWQKRLQRAETELSSLKVKKEESAAALLARAEALVKRHQMTGLLTVQVHETISQEKHYLGPGRPSPNRPFELREVRLLHVTFERDEAALAELLALLGWRIYVTNVSAEIMSLEQAMAYYRDEWLVERGFHRFKRGSLPALPLWVRLPERIRGLMLLLLIALQALALLEFVAQRELARRGESLAGLVPGNPKMKTNKPSAERLLARFQPLHMTIRHTGTHVEGQGVEMLNPLQRRILDLLSVPETIYELAFRKP